MKASEWSNLEFRLDGVVVISPCLAFTLHLERIHESGILDFYERSMEALGSLLAYSSAGTSSPRKVNSRTLATVPSWKGKMAQTRAGLQVSFSSVADGVGPASLRLSVSATPYSSSNAAEAAKGRKELKTTYEEHGDVNVFTSADLYVSFPLDHPLAREPARMVSWIRQLRLVREGNFSSGTCGLALNCDIISAGVQYARAPELRCSVKSIRASSSI